MKWKRGYDWSSVAVVMLPTDNVVSVEYGCARDSERAKGCLDGLLCSTVHILKWCSIYSVLSNWNRQRERDRMRVRQNCIFVHLSDGRGVLSIQSKFRFIQNPLNNTHYKWSILRHTYTYQTVKLWSCVLSNFFCFASNGGAYQNLHAALTKAAFLLWLFRIVSVYQLYWVRKKMKLTCGILVI